MATIERRVATVLFADLVGFTTLSEDLDPEDVAALQEHYFTLARDAVLAHGGRVEKYIGDAVVGAFGVPRAGDHDAVSAVRAGLAIVQAVADLGSVLALAPGTLRVRVGVSTGEVVATYADPQRTQWRLTGDVVNTAARLQSAAEPDTVLLGAGTQLAVHRRYRTEPVGPLTLKGKSEPVPAWVVTAPRATPDEAARSPTVGREADLAALAHAADLSAGSSVNRLLVAPPGVGKTRLLEEFTVRSRAAGRAVWAAQVGVGSDSGYGVVAALVRAALGPAGMHDLPARLAGGSPGLRDELAARHTAALLEGTTPWDTPEDLYTSWLAVLDRCAGPYPAIWAVEDLHHAGPDLLAFLGHAVTTCPPVGAPGRLVIATARPAVLEAMGAGAPDWAVHHLEPLTSAAAGELVDALVGEGTLPRGIRDGVLNAAAGNPLFIEELARSWVLSGALRRAKDGAWRFAGGDWTGPLPSTVHAIYLGQLDTFDQHQRRLVTAASIVGRTFPAGALVPLGTSEPTAPLAQLTRWGVLTGPGPGPVANDSYTYRHGVLRDVAYASLLRAERADLHQRFARWVARTAGFAGADETVGLHLAAAHDHVPAHAGVPRGDLAREAAVWLQRAATRLMTGAPQRAITLLRRALDLTATGPDADVDEVVLRLRLDLAEGLRRSGASEAAMEVFASVGALAGCRHPAILASAALRYEDALLASRLPRDRWGAQGVAMLDAAVDQAYEHRRSELIAALGQALVHGGRLGVGAVTLHRALRLARDAGDQRLVARALLALRAAQTGPEDLPDRLAGSAEIIRCARSSEDLEVEVEGARLRMIDLLEAGDRPGAEEMRRRASELTVRLGRASHLWYPAMWAAMGALLSGDGDAEALVERFREDGERWGYRDVGHVHRAQLLHLRVDQGRTVEALPMLEQMRPGFPGRWAPLLAYGYACAGRVADAHRELATHAESGFASIPADLSWSYLAALCAATIAELSDLDAARTLLPLLRPWAGRIVVLGSGAVCLGAASHFVGLLAREAGEPGEAAAMLADAVEVNDALGARPWAARSRAALAGLVRADGEEAGD